jgi:hypothetical protein
VKFLNLYLIAHEGHAKIVHLLLQQPNIDLNKEGDWNDSPLDSAREKDHTEVVQLLVNDGTQ